MNNSIHSIWMSQGDKMTEESRVTTVSKLDKIKIKSDGTIPGTKIYNSDGVIIGLIQEAVITLSAHDQPSVHLTVLLPELDISNVEVTQVTKVTVPYYEIGSEGEVVGFCHDTKKVF